MGPTEWFLFLAPIMLIAAAIYEGDWNIAVVLIVLLPVFWFTVGASAALNGWGDDGQP